jgi:lysophospholipase L1-like esterase
MGDINEFIQSSNNTLVDTDLKTRKTLTGIENDGANAVRDIYENAQTVDVGNFYDGFVYTKFNDAGTYQVDDGAGGTYTARFKYIGNDQFPITVIAGTNPLLSPGLYEQVTFNTASAIETDGGQTVQEELDSYDSLLRANLIAQGYSGDYGFFADGFNYVNIGDVGIDTNDNTWIYVGVGAPAKTVTAGTVPSVSAGYSLVKFRGNDIISASLKATSGRLSAKGDAQVVITGDSLSYNYQDYDATPRNNAVDCFAGMNSWSFMLRDAMFTSDPSWQYIEDMWGNNQVEIFGESTTCEFNAASMEQQFPLHGRVATFRMNVNDNPAIGFRVFNTSNTDSMYFMQMMISDQASVSCNYRVLVDGVEVYPSLTNKSPPANKFRGGEQRIISIPVPNDGNEHIVSFLNFTQAADTPEPTGKVIFNMGGFTSVRTNCELTGTGGYTSTQLLSTWAQKVTNYNPDLLVCIVGANDAFQGTDIDLFKQNIRDMSSLAKASNSGCQILWLSTPYSNEDLVLNSVAQQYVDALRSVCVEIGDNFIDIVSFFEMIPTSEYRFDNIHWTREGNALLSRYVAEVLGYSHKNIDLKPNYSLYGNAVTPGGKYVKKSVDLISGITSSASKVFTVTRERGPSSEVLSAEAVPGTTAVIEVTMSKELQNYHKVEVEKFGFSSSALRTIVTVFNRGTTTFRFVILNPDGTAVQDVDWDASPEDFKFKISCS